MGTLPLTGYVTKKGERKGRGFILAYDKRGGELCLCMEELKHGIRRREEPFTSINAKTYKGGMGGAKEGHLQGLWLWGVASVWGENKRRGEW